MKRYPKKLRALINFENNKLKSEELALRAFRWAMTDYDWRLDGYNIVAGEDFGWFTLGAEYTLIHDEKRNGFDLLITVFNTDIPYVCDYKYSDIQNITSLVRATKTPVKVRKVPTPSEISRATLARMEKSV